MGNAAGRDLREDALQGVAHRASGDVRGCEDDVGWVTRASGELRPQQGESLLRVGVATVEVVAVRASDGRADDVQADEKGKPDAEHQATATEAPTGKSGEGHAQETRR